MLRLLASAVLHLIGNAVGLVLASLILSGFSINGAAFVVALLIFTAVEVVMGPLIAKIALKNVPSLLGGIALVTTFVGLLVTDIVSSGLSISGATTWILATLIVWLGALIAGILLPLVLFRKVMRDARDDRR
jgi:putative membrane protein